MPCGDSLRRPISTGTGSCKRARSSERSISGAQSMATRCLTRGTLLLQAEGASQRDRRLRSIYPRGRFAGVGGMGCLWCRQWRSRHRRSLGAHEPADLKPKRTTIGRRLDWLLGDRRAGFFPPDEWVEVPSDWRREIVSGKTYDLNSGEGKLLYECCIHRAAQAAAAQGWSEDQLGERYGPAQLVHPRLGQASFRLAVLDAYGRRCAVTGERSLPVVEAAHIRPYGFGGEHVVPNGLPLRRDVHRLFDLGFVSVRPDHHFAVSKALQDEYENGKVYYELDDRSLLLPEDPRNRPSPELLNWHYEKVFRG